VNATVGATLFTVTVAEAMDDAPPAVHLTRTVKTPSCPTRSNVTLLPVASLKLPSLSKSHANCSGCESGSLQVAASATLVPSLVV